MLTTLEQRSSEIVHENPYWQYRKDRYTYPNGGEGEYHYVQTPGAVFVIALTDDGKFILLKQYRYLNRREGVEFIGGGIKKGQGPEEAAKAELLEEAGITSNQLLRIGEFNPMNGVTDEICHVFVATELSFGKAKTEESEEFEMVIASVDDFRAMIARGDIWDGMTLAAFSLFLHCYSRS